MKVSRYNFFIHLDNDCILAYNALTNGFAVVDRRCADLLAGFSEEKLADLEPQVQGELIRGGFIVGDEVDERDVVRVRMRAQQYEAGALALTVAPTLSCNLACRYCFESCFRGVMSDTTQEALAEFAARLLPPRGGALAVTWYGGEPLLALSVILGLTEKLRAVCGARQATYEASVITNGTLLSREVAQQLLAVGVTHAQVTLDGPPEVHDQRRPFRSGGGSFRRIVENLAQAVELLPISLRINVDRHNAEKALEFVEWLFQQPWFARERIGVHFGYVRKYTPSCGCGLEEMLKPEDFFALSERLSNALVEKGLAAPPYPELAGGCTATSANSFVIGPEGELYRCWNHVGDPKMVVGTVFDEVKPHPLYLKYLLASFEEDPECLECQFLPLCAGGCVDLRIKAQQGAFPHKDCSQWRYSLQRRLEAYYRWWWQNQGQDARRER
ncbi:MAG: radical SAM protein [Thermoanaerobaculum sp.]